MRPPGTAAVEAVLLRTAGRVGTAGGDELDDAAVADEVDGVACKTAGADDGAADTVVAAVAPARSHGFGGDGMIIAGGRLRSSSSWMTMRKTRHSRHDSGPSCFVSVPIRGRVSPPAKLSGLQ